MKATPKRRPQEKANLKKAKIPFEKNSVQCHPKTEGEKAKLYNLPNHTKDEMKN